MEYLEYFKKVFEEKEEFGGNYKMVGVDEKGEFVLYNTETK